jgi:hypothetical protein
VGSSARGHEIELAAEEQDTSAEVVEAAEATGVSLMPWMMKFETFCGGVGDAVPGVVDQPVAVAAKHLRDSLDGLDAVAHRARIPSVEKGA